MTFSLGNKSLEHLVGVHPDLVKVVQDCIAHSPVDFSIVQGLRTPAQEAHLVAIHASTTMHSRHLPNKQGFACAIDFAAFVGGSIVWDPISLYQTIADAMKDSGKRLGIPVEWGGDWVSFKDYGHVQLPWASYP